MRKFYTMLLLAILSFAGLPATAAPIEFTLHLEKGSSAVLMDYSFSSYDYVLRQTLVEGDNLVSVERRETVYLFPAPGVESVTITPANDNVTEVTKDGKTFYSIYAAGTLAGQTFTVTTSGGQGGKPTTHVFLAPGAQAQVLELNERTYEYTQVADLHDGDNAVELDTESAAVPGTVPFYYICGKDGFILDNATDASGNTIELKENGELGTYIELTAFTFLPEYHITTKEKPAPVGDPTFILSEGSRAYYIPVGRGSKKNLTPGSNYVTLDESSIRVYPMDGHHFTSFTDRDGNAMTVNKNGYVELNPNYLFRPPYSITTAVNENPDPTFTLTIDDTSLAECSFFPSYSRISLTNGENVITFSEYGEKTIILSTKRAYGDWTPFYSVKVNGVEEKSSYQHFIDIADGMKIEVLVNAPADEKYTYNLEYTEGAEAFWSSIYVNDERIIPAGNSFEAPAGAKIDLYNTDAENWVINEILLPDGTRHTAIKNPLEPLSFFAKGGTIKVDARKAQTFNVTLNIISGVENIKVTNGNFNTGTEVTGLKNGLNPLTIKENSDYFYIRHVEETGVIMSVTYKRSTDGELLDAEYNGYFNYYIASNLREGAEITVVAGELEYPHTCQFYVDDATDVILTGSSGRSFSLKTGYTNVIFNEVENGATGFTIGAPAQGKLFVNDEAVENTAKVRLQHDGVYKLYLANTDPRPLAVTVNAAEGYGMEATVDVIRTVESPLEGFSVLPGTRLAFTVTVPEGRENVVKCNDEDLTPDSDGIYTLDVNAPVALTIGTAKTPDKPDSIETITAAEADRQAQWFDLTGRRIAAERLLPGLYIKVTATEAVKTIVK